MDEILNSLDEQVAKAQGFIYFKRGYNIIIPDRGSCIYSPTTNETQAFELIVKYHIEISRDDRYWSTKIDCNGVIAIEYDRILEIAICKAVILLAQLRDIK